LTWSSDAIPCCRAAPATSSIVIRLRARFRSIGAPSWTTITGSPAITGLAHGSLKSA
jgi:hypothetical protein